MKRFLYPMILMLAACSAEPASLPEEGRLTVSLSGAPTRSAATDAEKRIWNAQFLLFDERGALCCWQRTLFPQAEEMYRADLTVPTGRKQVWVVTNLERSLQDVGSVGELLEETLLLTDNALFAGGTEGLVMAGNGGPVEIRAGQTAACRIDVHRLVARVHVGTVENALPGGTAVGTPVLRLSNVVADRSLSGSASPGRWCNKLLNGGGDLPEQAPVSGASIPAGSSWNCDARLYAFPNSTDPDRTGGSFSPRKTRLVLQCTLDGSVCYYPVTLDRLEENTSYSVNLTLQRPGSSDPDVPVQSGAYRFTIVPEPWNDSISYSETL